MIPVLHGVWAAAGGLVGDFEHIETQTVGAGGAASVTFSSIPGTYKHLQIRAVFKSSAAISSSGSGLRLNSSTATYPRHDLFGNGANALSSANTSGNNFAAIDAAGDSYNQWAAVIVDLLDYTSTTKNKTIRSLYGMDNNGSGGIALVSSLWINTSAVTSITLYGNNVGSVQQHSTYALYGVK